MANRMSWVQLEREVLRRINVMRGDTDTEADTLAKKAPPLVTTDLQDAAFPLFSVRLECVQAVNEMAAMIARTVGEPYRKIYRSLVVVNAQDSLPESMGPYGAVNFLNTNVANNHAAYRIPVERVESPRNILDRLLATTTNLFGSTNCYQWSDDGAAVYATVFPIEIECFVYTRVGVDGSGNLDVAAVTALFDTWADEAQLPNEYTSICADLAASRLASQAGAYLENAQLLMQLFEKAVAARGWSQFPNDQTANPKGDA